ncbi:MAG: HAMP domain-containing histidine kinase, partial [Deltaproteobacteria bacterium]|nr:HAMP domain-containing histidine kinase [Deltaproteobacteria bacterium]
ERDALLREKVTALQRLIVNDRIRCLAAMAAGLSHHIRNPMSALMTFLDLVPKKLKEEVPEPSSLKDTRFWEDFSSLARKESERLMEMIGKMSVLVVEPSNNFKGEISLHDIATRVVKRLEGEDGMGTGKARLDMAADLASLKADPVMLERLFSILIRETAKRNPLEGTVTFGAGKSISVRETPGVSLFVQGDGPAWNEEQVASLFAPFSERQEALQDPGLDLLPAFFIVHHHNGDLIVHKGGPFGPG